MLQVFQPQLPIASVHAQQDDRLSGPYSVPLPAKEVFLGSFLCPATRSQSSGSRSTQGLYMSPDVTSGLHADNGAEAQDVSVLDLSSASPLFLQPQLPGVAHTECLSVVLDQTICFSAFCSPDQATKLFGYILGVGTACELST